MWHRFAPAAPTQEPSLQPERSNTSPANGPDRRVDLTALLESVFGSAPFGFALYDQDVRYQVVNQTMADLNGRSIADHMGLSIEEVAPDLAAQVRAAVTQVARSGEPIIDVELVGETPGEPGKRGIWLNSFYRIDDPAGNVFGVVAMARDVTEERRLQQQVAAEQFRAAFDASLEPALMLAADLGPDGNLELWVDYMNPAAAERTGLSLAEAIGHRLGEVFPAADELGLDVHCHRVLDTGRPFTGRGLVYTTDGEGEGGHFDVSVSRTPGGLLLVWRDAELERRLAEHQVALVAERSRVAQLQRSFLPRHLPQPPGVRLAARYRSAERDAPLGGDWYDALALDGQLVLCIGDVAGHGMSAVETMGVARITARAFIVEDRRPDRVLSRLDAYADRITGSTAARPLMTMIAVAYDPVTRRLSWSNAGHPPPVLLDHAGARLLTSPPLPPLGSGRGGYRAHEVEVGPGSTLVLYTDGLIERRNESLDDGLSRLLDALRELPDDPGAACDVVLQRCIEGHGHHDDVCLLVLRTA